MGRIGTTVLVVDDDELMLELAVAALDELGFSLISSALSGEDGLRILDRGGAEIVLCDLNMPEMDGVEFLRHLSARRFEGAIVLMSGEDKRILRTAESLARAHGLNVVAAVEKPINAAVLGVLRDHVGTATRSSMPPPAPTHKVSVHELREAIANDDIMVYFQPKISVASGRCTGVETLARWKHRVHGFVPPSDFIAVAEREGLIDHITRVILGKALREAGRWIKHGHDLSIAINVSTQTVGKLDLPDFVYNTARTHGVEPSRVMVEVTETQIMRNLTCALDTLTRLRLRRIGLSIDDFGTGYSSLEQLQRVPFVELKVDRAFVDGASHDAAARAILESSIDLAKKLGLSTVAEGVERSDDYQLLEKLGCDLAQGWLFAAAMPGDALLPWIESRSNATALPAE
jgi:EAL domain-containing protein (putative c-di-GMP-specific phosphodiesterase class I)/ActR/RegA family two-component response regulator